MALNVGGVHAIPVNLLIIDVNTPVDTEPSVP